ncbi:MAG: FMN-binding negative transcriptional regulator [Caldilineaceae bacterium]|nr:FMN-binding negative transcriptional regulator [Caldilineaceae bacterium]
MYLPPAFREDDATKMVAFMRAHSFATLVSVVNGAPFATHLPLTVEERGEALVVTGHVAKPNPHWQGFDHAESLAIFGGPHAYISPSLYEKVESVPTWNYIAVHAYGAPIIYTYANAPEKVQGMLEAMMQSYEPSYLAQWETLTDKYRAGMMQGIVAFEMPITRLEGKYKLSQNRSMTDQAAVAEHLQQAADPTAAAIGTAMQSRIEQEQK